MEKQRSAAVAKLNVNNPTVYSSPTSNPLHPVKPVEHNHTASPVGLPSEGSRRNLWRLLCSVRQAVPSNQDGLNCSRLQGELRSNLPSVYSRRRGLSRSCAICSPLDIWVLISIFFSFMLCYPMLYSWLLSGQVLLTGRPGDESIEAGKKKSSLQIFFFFFSFLWMTYYVSYRIQNRCFCFSFSGVKRNPKATNRALMADVYDVIATATIRNQQNGTVWVTWDC